MAKINRGRVVLGGVLWVVMFNVIWMSGWYFALENGWMSALAALGRPWPQTLGTLVLWLSLTFALGIFAIWFYAAVRPRYGPGPQTAALVGVAIWLISGIGPTVWYAHILQLPTGLVVSSMAVELIADVVATILGAWPYKEEQAEPLG